MAHESIITINDTIEDSMNTEESMHISPALIENSIEAIMLSLASYSMATIDDSVNTQDGVNTIVDTGNEFTLFGITEESYESIVTIDNLDITKDSALTQNGTQSLRSMIESGMQNVNDETDNETNNETDFSVTIANSDTVNIEQSEHSSAIAENSVTHISNNLEIISSHKLRSGRGVFIHKCVKCHKLFSNRKQYEKHSEQKHS